jgi:hypothetical protein
MKHLRREVRTEVSQTLRFLKETGETSLRAKGRQGN